ncbi:MAG: DUF5667 domain-containing protein [Microgenomates group bacterium]
MKLPKRIKEIKFLNLLIIVCSLIFAFLILFVSILKSSVSQRDFSSLISDQPSVLKEELGEYFLVNPGILPDHFLYPLKMIRDRLKIIFTFDSLKKAQLYLLYADKRLAAGKALVEKGKIKLGISTLSKGEKYLEKAFLEQKIAKKEGKNTDKFLKKLYLASQKHKEVLLEIFSLIESGEEKNSLKSLLDYPETIIKEIDKELNF